MEDKKYLNMDELKDLVKLVSATVKKIADK